MERFNNILYELPTIRIIGGATDSWLFHLHTPEGQLFDMCDGSCVNTCECMPNCVTHCQEDCAGFCTADCSIVAFGDRASQALRKFNCSFERGPAGKRNVLRVNLPSDATVDLWGKYVYQITIKLHDHSRHGKVDIPMHGILYIGNNINPGFLPAHDSVCDCE